jgi:predicted nucleic acid-binding protein
MRQVFVDTGAFFALLVREDEMHPIALEIFREASKEKWRLVTTNIVVFETYSLILERSHGGRNKALFFLDYLNKTYLRIERASLEDEKNAISLVWRHKDKKYSLCDALSFVVMERLQIREAIAFDKHFREYGKFIVNPSSL